MTRRPRRCGVCRSPLPPDASPRRRYCSPACVARDYRARRRRAEIHDALVRDARAVVAGGDLEFGVVCPGCGWRIYPGGAFLRADARHCSPTCRQRAYRARHRVRHGARQRG